MMNDCAIESQHAIINPFDSFPCISWYSHSSYIVDVIGFISSLKHNLKGQIVITLDNSLCVVILCSVPWITADQVTEAHHGERNG